MRINFVTTANDTVASYRYRISKPTDELTAKGHDVRLNATGGGYISVYSKHFNAAEDHQNITWHGHRATVFDVCDNHFESDFAPHYQFMCKHADMIIASTPKMQECIKKHTGKDSVIIPDPYEWEEREPKKLKKIEKLMWYGHPVNMQALLRIMPEIDGYSLLAVGKPMTWFDFPVTPYSKEMMQVGFDNSDVVIIPVTSDPRAQVKGANRMIEAIRQGVFVIAEPLPCYQEFKDWMFIGGIRDGLEFVQKNIKELPGRVKAAQEYIRDRYSPETIGGLWETQLKKLDSRNSISAVEGASSKDTKTSTSPTTTAA